MSEIEQTAPAPSDHVQVPSPEMRLKIERISDKMTAQFVAGLSPEAIERLRAALPPQVGLQGVDIARLPIGTAVEKVGGYPFPGTVVASFHTLAGQERFVVEATGEQYAGMLHIFNGGQLRPAASEGSTDE